MKKHILTVILATGLTITSGGWVISNNDNQEMIEKISKNHKEIEQKSTEIAKLENVAKKQGEKLDADKKVIEKQKSQIQNKNEETKKLKVKNQELKQKLKVKPKVKVKVVEKVVYKNFNRTVKGSDVKKISTKQQEKTTTSVKLPTKKKELVVKEVATKQSVTSNSSHSIGNFQMTSYIGMCSEGCTGITATGVNVKNTVTYQGYRIIATDPNVIPLWSIVKITTSSGSFNAISLDTGGGINGNEIDFLVSSEGEALSNGRQNVSIEMIRKGK